MEQPGATDRLAHGRCDTRPPHFRQLRASCVPAGALRARLGLFFAPLAAPPRWLATAAGITMQACARKGSLRRAWRCRQPPLGEIERNLRRCRHACQAPQQIGGKAPDRAADAGNEGEGNEQVDVDVLYHGFTQPSAPIARRGTADRRRSRVWASRAAVPRGVRPPVQAVRR